MREHALIVLAAGEAKRFDGEIAKQRLTVGGEELLERIERLFGEPVVMTNNPEVIASGVGIPARPQRSENTSATVWSSRAYWGSVTTTILFGDVYYTEGAASQILGCTDDLAFFTDGQDLFALTFTAKMNREVAGAAEHCANVGNNRGRVWEIYRKINGGIHDFPVKPGDAKHPMLQFITDATQDFDSMEEYEAFLEGRSKNVLKK